MTTQRVNKKIGFLSLLLAGASFGSFGIWIRLLVKELGLYEQIVLRNVVVLVLSLIVITLGKKSFSGLKKVPKVSLLLYALTIPLAVVFFNLSVMTTKIAVTTFAFYIGTIIFGIVAGKMMFKEELTMDKKVSLVMVVLGLITFLYPFDLKLISVGILWGLVAGVVDGISNVLRKDLAGKVDKFVLVLLTGIGGIVISGLLIFAYQENPLFIFTMSSTSWLIGIVFGALLILVNFMVLVGFQNYDLNLGSVVLATELFFAPFFAYIFLREIPSAKELIGGSLVLVGVIFPNFQYLLQKKRS